MDLDDASKWRPIDRSGMAGLMGSYVDAFSDAFAKAARVDVKAPADAKGLILAGMGGSGIGGEIAACLVADRCPVPATVVKHYDAPAWMGRGALVIATSYSGGTEETLHIARKALERGATLLCIGSGGPLAELAQEGGAVHVPVPGGKPPRVALPELLGSVLGALHALGWGPGPLDEGTGRSVRDVHQTVLPSTPTTGNPAKALAHAFHDRLPVWYASPPLAAVAVRARCQLNENAKMIARDDVIPEANHNDIVAWGSVRNGSTYYVPFLREAEEPPPIRRRFEFFSTVLQRAGVGSASFVADAPTPTARLLQALLVVDYASLYAAFLRGVDPTPVDVIGELKQRLQAPS